MREIINALEKLVGFITGIVIGILTVVITLIIGMGFNINEHYPGGLHGFGKDGVNKWKNWEIIDDKSKSDKKTESEE